MGKSRSFTNLFTLALSVMGIVVASVLLVEHFLPKVDIGCSRFGGDCSRTVHSAYGSFGPIPTAAFGLGMYLLLAALCFLRHKRLQAARSASLVDNYILNTAPVMEGAAVTAGSGDFPALDVRTPPAEPSVPGYIRQLDLGIWGLAVIGVGISWWLQYNSLFVMETFCPWCFTSAMLITLIFLLASFDGFLAGRRLDGEQRLLAGVLSIIVLLLGVVYIPPFWQQTVAVIKRGAPVASVSNDQRKFLLSNTLHSKGEVDSPYTIVEFADYTCSHCKEASDTLETLIKTVNKPVRLVFRNYPLKGHKWAREAAQTAEAAGEQGKFWEMHDYLFAHQKEMDELDFKVERFDDYARELGLNIEKFKKDRTSPIVVDRIIDDVRAAELGELPSTPTFFFISRTHVTRLVGMSNLAPAMIQLDSPIWE